MPGAREPPPGAETEEDEDEDEKRRDDPESEELATIKLSKSAWRDSRIKAICSKWRRQMAKEEKIERKRERKQMRHGKVKEKEEEMSTARRRRERSSRPSPSSCTDLHGAIRESRRFALKVKENEEIRGKDRKKKVRANIERMTEKRDDVIASAWRALKDK